MSLRLFVVMLAVASCATSPRTTWVTTKPESIEAETRAAIAKGLIPVLYLDAPFTIASTNVLRWRDAKPMRAALDGLAIIHVQWNDTERRDDLRPYLWHSFQALDARGKPTGAILEPGTKEGPCSDGSDVDACAAWIAPFARSLRPHS